MLGSVDIWDARVTEYVMHNASKRGLEGRVT